MTIELTDLIGHVVYSNKVITINGELKETVKLQNALANGMYLLSVRSAAESKIFHVVIEK